MKLKISTAYYQDGSVNKSNSVIFLPFLFPIHNMESNKLLFKPFKLVITLIFCLLCIFKMKFGLPHELNNYRSNSHTLAD
jgi:hypothetical protein